jgi:hypothetical protein
MAYLLSDPAIMPGACAARLPLVALAIDTRPRTASPRLIPEMPLMKR